MILVVVIYAAILFATAWLVKNYPETISGFSTLSKEERAKYDMPKIGRFVSRWLVIAGITALMSLLMPSKELHIQALVVVPIFCIVICWAYLVKYKNSRFKR